MRSFSLQKNESARRVAQHIRHDSQQRELQGHLHHPVPEQVGPAGAQGGPRRHRHPLVLPAVRGRPAQPAGRPGLPAGHVRGRPARAQDDALPPLHHRHRHAQHRGGLQLGERHHPQPQPGVPHAAVTGPRASPL